MRPECIYVVICIIILMIRTKKKIMNGIYNVISLSTSVDEDDDGVDVILFNGGVMAMIAESLICEQSALSKSVISDVLTSVMSVVLNGAPLFSVATVILFCAAACT